MNTATPDSQATIARNGAAGASRPHIFAGESFATFVRLSGTSLLAAGVLVAVGYWPAAMLAPGAGGETLLLAIGVALVGSIAAHVLPSMSSQRSPKVLAGAILASLGVRFFVTMAAGLLLWSRNVVPGDLLLLMVGIAQFVLLGADAATLIRLTRKIGTEASC